MKVENINITHNKKENVNIIAFSDYYLSKYHTQVGNITIRCPDEEVRDDKAPDYLLEEVETLVEVKEIHHREELEGLINWSRNAARLHSTLKTKDLSLIKGSYLINTPPLLKINNDKKANEIIEQILRGINNGQSEITIGKFGKFQIDKFNNEGSYISFGSSSGGGFINPPGIIYDNIVVKTDDVNKKLSINAGANVSKRIWLLVGKYFFAKESQNVIDAFSQIYGKLLESTSIDEIWLQLETRDGKWLHTLIYSRNFFCDFKNEQARLDSQTFELFEKWFTALEKLGDIHKDKLFKMMRVLLGDKKPFEVFENKFARQEMVRLGEWLIDKERYADSIWLINKFIDDPDPGDPGGYQGDPAFNYHAKILAGEEISHITTVLGHLAWVVQKLGFRDEYMAEALRYTETLINHRNYYVKLQALVPLRAISGRRVLLSGYGRRPYCENYKKFHDIVFSVLGLLRSNLKLKAICRRLVDIFNYYKDLNTQEIMEVLDVLRSSRNSASLFVYYGIYRKNHFKEQPIEFDSAVLNKRFVGMLKSKQPEDVKFHSSFAWIFRDILDEEPSELKTIKPYFELLLKQPYERTLYDNIQYFLQKWIDKEPELCLQWFETMMHEIVLYTRRATVDKKRVDLWLDVTEEVIKTMASRCPQKLIDTMKLLSWLWEKGAYIGDIKTLFESFKMIKNPKIREDTKSGFQRIYTSMKKLNSRLKEVGWD